MKKYIGLAMLAAPFGGIAAFAAPKIGIGTTILIFVGIAALIGWIYVGVKLALDALP